MKTLKTPMQASRKSRRFIKDEWHPYGWTVSFRQNVWEQGQLMRKYFSGLGVNRQTAIWNALGDVDEFNKV